MPSYKTFYYLTAVLFLILLTAGNSEKTLRGKDARIERKVESLLRKMTLEEKAGQMTNISMMALAKGEFWMRRDTVILDTAKMLDLLINKHVGSVQNLGTYPFPTTEWRQNIHIIQEIVKNESRLGIPIIYGIDAVHGANYTAGSTLFPQQLALAATWNPALAHKCGEITAYEIKASGIPWNYSPVLDVSKQPLWGRIFETFGEDTYLASEMGKSYIKGSQGDNISDDFSAAVCLKHFWGYGQPYNGKDRSPTLLPERLLRQYHLPPFKAAVESGAMTVMLNSGSVNGIPSHADHYLITGILKGELAFQGFTISDWEDVVNLVKTHQVAADEKDAVRISVNAGLDMCMEPYDASFADFLIELVNEGKVEMARVDDAVRRILRVKFKLGLFKDPLTDANLYPKFGSEEFTNESYNSASECLTLLKNEGKTLPFKDDAKILLTGVGAHSLNYLNGAWTRTWGGSDTSFNDIGKLTVLEALEDKLGKQQVSYVQGTSHDEEINIDQAVEVAQEVDYIVVVLGEKPATEKPSDIEDLTMPRAQLNLVKELFKTGKPIILILLEARPRIISEIEPLAKSILLAYLPGNEGGRAIADALIGTINPSGKLPMTYPRRTGSIWSYDHTKADERDGGFGFDGFNPQYEFGYGLSYTKYVYSSLKLDRDTYNMSDTITVTVKVKNIGERAGKEVVQLYSSDLVASVVPAVKQLRKFNKINLEPGQEKEVVFKLSPSDLAFVDQSLKWVTEEGEFKLSVDSLSTNFNLIQ